MVVRSRTIVAPDVFGSGSVGTAVGAVASGLGTSRAAASGSGTVGSAASELGTVGSAAGSSTVG